MAWGFLPMYILARNFARWFGAEADLKAIREGLGISFIPWVLVFLVWNLLQPSRTTTFPAFFLGFIYGFTIVLIAMGKIFNVGAFEKALLILSFTFLVTLWPINQVFKMLLSF